MTHTNQTIRNGYLDVKISTKVKRGFTPWKAWKKQWCEICLPNKIGSDLEIKMGSSMESGHWNSIFIPRNAMICRTESRSKQFAFGVFGTDRDHKPLVFLSGGTESDSQLWMYSIRKMLSISPYVSVSEESFYVSLVDNIHSRSSNTTGIHGFLTCDGHGLTIRNPVNQESIMTLQWYQFHQFHLAATGSLEDEKKIVVMHTSKEFPGGAGQMHFYCLEAPSLLEILVARGKSCSKRNFSKWRRFSRSEGDLRDTDLIHVETPTSPVHFRSHSGSDDSGVRVSMTSDDSSLVLKCKMAMNYLSVGFTGLIGATPGGSEVDNESVHELLNNVEETSFLDDMQSFNKGASDPRRESGVSILSGVYEEISEIPPPKGFRNDDKNHFYEDPMDILLGKQEGLAFLPPPLPPRQDTLTQISSTESDFDLLNMSSQTPEIKGQNGTDEILNDFLSDSFYTVMNAGKSQTESHYVPMFPVKELMSEESPYLAMTGKEE